MSAGLELAAVPTTVHCDHSISSRDGEAEDLPRALEVHREVYEFMESACQKYHLGFWKPGAGIIHQIVLENYAFPPGMMVDTDSLTPNAGGIGMIAIGVGGADAVDVMTGLPLGLTAPKVLGVRLTGELWVSLKDIINTVAGILSVKGANWVIRYFGPGCRPCQRQECLQCVIWALRREPLHRSSYMLRRWSSIRANNRPDMTRAVEAISFELSADKSAALKPGCDRGVD